MADSHSGVLSRMSNHAYGVGFLAIVALLVGLSIASFQKRFTPVVMVSLLTDRVGSQLQAGSDVKLRGLIVGEVRSVRTTGDGARLGLALDPGKVALIPGDVTARLLPKTLFGERFVDLVAPDAGTGTTTGTTTGTGAGEGSGEGSGAVVPIRAGAVIGQDRTSVAIELEKVFDDLLPLLRTVRPERLAATLNALASALEGRGQRLGQNLVLVDSYFAALNPRMPVIRADISGLADLASTYAVAAPDLVAAAGNLVTTNTTIVQRRDALAGFLAGTAGFANTTADFLAANGQRIIQVGRVQRPTLELFATYSPQYPCFTQALVDWTPRIDEAWRDTVFHLTIETSPQRPGYHPGEEPRWGERRPASCGLLPHPKTSQAHPVPGKKFDDGTEDVDGQTSGPNLSALPPMFARADAVAIPDADSGLAGTEQEQRLIAALLASDGSQPSADRLAITALLAGPLLRGTIVNQVEAR